jgi:hypothetical protein
MRIQFPLTLAAVQKGEKSQWAIGDALLAEIKPSKSGIRDKSRQQFAVCSRELAEQGFEAYSAGRLRHLRDLAQHFPAGRRQPAVSLDAHISAGSPENLTKVIEALNKINKPVTIDNVRLIMKAWREKDADEREEKRKKAGAKRRAATIKKRKATTPAERKAAQDEEKQAAADEARYSKPPATLSESETEAPADSELKIQATCLEIEADAEMMTKTLSKNFERLDNLIDKIDPDTINVLQKHHENMLKAVEKILAALKGKRRFKVHQGGAA